MLPAIKNAQQHTLFIVSCKESTRSSKEEKFQGAWQQKEEKKPKLITLIFGNPLSRAITLKVILLHTLVFIFARKIVFCTFISYSPVFLI